MNYEGFEVFQHAKFPDLIALRRKRNRNFNDIIFAASILEAQLLIDEMNAINPDPFLCDIAVQKSAEEYGGSYNHRNN